MGVAPKVENGPVLLSREGALAPVDVLDWPVSRLAEQIVLV